MNLSGFYRNSDEELCVQGIPITDLAKKYGTPLFIYDSKLMKERYSAFLETVAIVKGSIHYAVKANDALAIVSYFKKLGCGADIVSIGEFEKLTDFVLPDIQEGLENLVEMQQHFTIVVDEVNDLQTVDVKKEDKTPKEGYIKEVIGGYGPTNFFYVDSSGISKGIRESEAKRRMEREGIEWRKVKYK